MLSCSFARLGIASCSAREKGVKSIVCLCLVVVVVVSVPVRHPRGRAMVTRLSCDAGVDAMFARPMVQPLERHQFGYME